MSIHELVPVNFQVYVWKDIVQNISSIWNTNLEYDNKDTGGGGGGS